MMFRAFWLLTRDCMYVKYTNNKQWNCYIVTKSDSHTNLHWEFCQIFSLPHITYIFFFDINLPVLRKPCNLEFSYVFALFILYALNVSVGLNLNESKNAVIKEVEIYHVFQHMYSKDRWIFQSWYRNKWKRIQALIESYKRFHSSAGIDTCGPYKIWQQFCSHNCSIK